MFETLSCRDFYKMLVEDFDDFMAEPQSVRRAWHCAITAYHLHEWVWGDWLKGNHAMRKAWKVTGREDFLSWIDQHCVWFAYVQQLATGAKHFVRAPGSQPIHTGGYGQGPYGVGSYGHGYLLLDLGEEAGEERWQTAATYLEVVVRFWRDFFRTYLPDPDQAVSKHHAD